MTGDYFVVRNDTGKPLTGLRALIDPFRGEHSTTGKRLSGANVRRRRRVWRRRQPMMGGIKVAVYDFWR